MRKLAIALGAVAFALSAAALPSVAATKAKDTTQAESTVKAKKKRVVKKATKVTEKYSRKCKAGQVWNPTASMSAGACEKRKAKVKVKAPSKAATKSASKKVG